MIKIAVVTDDEKTISRHFGRANTYVVLTVDDNHIMAREVRDKAGHRDFQQETSHGHEHHQHDGTRGRGYGKQAEEKHRRMFEAIPDCQILLARGMGQGAYQGLQQIGIRPVLTDIANIDTAVEAVIDGSIEDRPERLH
jgi:predicted Fe-Mo cluster-binding NifX family protein